MAKPKILLFDIETTPNLAYVWGKWQQNVISFKQEWELLSFAYKWLDQPNVYCVTRPEFKDKTDQSITKALWKLLDEADLIIAHNGDEFDVKKAKAKFIEHGLKPPSPYKTIDTKKVAKTFKFNSNSLDDLGRTLKVGKKLKTGGFDLWLNCMSGDKKAWAKMAEYNKQDVLLLEKVYLKLRPWIQNHPNLAQFHMDNFNHTCPKCNSTRLKSKGLARTKVSTYRRYVCMGCGGYCRARLPEKNRPKFVNI